MKNIKKSLSFVLLLIFAFSALLFGCGDKYANLKITTDAPETGINLYKGKDTENQILSVATFTATVSGAGDGVSTKLKYNLTNTDCISIVTEHLGEQTTFTVSALNYGTTTLTIFSEEADHITTAVKITVVKEVERLDLFTSYKPFVFAGSSTVIDTAKAINFYPEDTSQKEVTYAMVGQYSGVTVLPNGSIVATADAQSGSFEVIATSVDNAGISSQPISVRVFKPILQKDITVSYSDGRDSLVLSTSIIPDEVSKVVTLTINTQEDYYIDEPICISSNSDLVEIEKVDNNNFKITGISAGTGTLKFYIALTDEQIVYQNAKIQVEVPVVVKQYASSVKINGSSEQLNNVYLYNTYQNQRGQEFLINVGEETAQDKRFVVSLSEEDMQKVTIVDSSNNEIIPYTEGEYFDILNNNTTLFIRIKDGYEQESQATINFVAYGTFGLLCEPVSNSVVASLKHGVTQMNLKMPSLQQKDNVYLFGIDTNPQDDTHIISVEIDKNQFTDFIKTNVTGDNLNIQDKVEYKDSYYSNNNIVFDFVLSATAEGLSSIEFVAENGLYKIINIRVFNKINAFQVTTETINQNSHIGEVKYENQVITSDGVTINRNSLSKLALALNGEVKLGIIPIYYDGINAYNISSNYIVKLEVSGSDCVSFLSNNVLVAKRLTPVAETINVNMTVYNATGEILLNEQTIQIEVFYEIKQVFLNSTHVQLYTYNDLSTADKKLDDLADYEDKIATHKFTLWYFDGTNNIQITDNISWQIGGQDQSSIINQNGVVTATSLAGGRNTGLATLTAIYVNYGRTYIVQANIEIIRAVSINNIYNLRYTKDGKTTLLKQQNVMVSETFNNSTGDFEQVYEDHYYIYLDARDGIEKGQTFSIDQTIQPENAYNKKLIYKVENADKNDAVPVLSIDQNGTVTINRTGGTAFIYISAKDSEQSDGSYSTQATIFVKIADGNSSITALEISNEYDLLNINNNVESLSKFYQVTKDINLSYLTANSSWTPIGMIDGQMYEFSGNINGKIVNKGETYICTISGFNINLDSAQSVEHCGLFATLSQNAVINNLNISISKVNVNHTVADNSSIFNFGGLACVNNGTVKNVSVDIIDNNSQITECAYQSNIGGLIGANNGTIVNCYTSGYLGHVKQNSLTTSKTNIGGLVGTNNSKIDGNSRLVNDNSFADSYTSLITIDSSYKNENNQQIYNSYTGVVAVGGVVGQNNLEVINCSFEGHIKAINNVGGIVGINKNNIQNCFASGYINGNTNVGGIVGLSENGIINFCAVNMFDNYDIDYDKSITPNIIVCNDYIGGLVGKMQQTQLTNSYVKSYFVRTTDNYVGDIYAMSGARAQYIGGLVGYAQNSSIGKAFYQATINTKEVENAVVGGLVGGAENINIVNCYTMGNIKLNVQSSAGKMIGLLVTASQLTNSYSTITDDDIIADATSNTSFVGKINSGNLTIINSYHLSTLQDANATTSDKLKDKDTFINWNISDVLGTSDWYINGANNNGYPMLVVDNSKLSIEAPTNIQVELNSNNTNMQKLDLSADEQGHTLFAILWRGTTSTSIKLVDATNGLFKSISVQPDGAGMAYKITSSDESILRITGRNRDRIVPVANGQVTLTITSRLNNTISKKVKVYVVNKIEQFSLSTSSINSLVNQKKTVEVNAQNSKNYNLKINVTGGNYQYVNINNFSAENMIDIAFTRNLYIYSTKSVANPVTVTVTPYIEVAGIKIYAQAQSFTYTSYFGIKNFSCNFINVTITDNDSARLVYTASGDDLRILNDGSYKLPSINFDNSLADNLKGIFSLVKIETYVYDSAGELIDDYQTTQVSKIVYEYILKVNKQTFNSILASQTQIDFDVFADISLSTENVEGTFASAGTKICVTKQQLKNISLEFFTDSQKVKDKDGNEVYTANEASSHKIIAGKTGLLKVSLYPNTAEIQEVRVYSKAYGTYNISMSQLLKRPVYDTTDTSKINSYCYVERKPYAINLIGKNGLLLWNESNIDQTTTFDGTYYVGCVIPSAVAEGTVYTVYVEADLKDGRTIIQSYELYSDIPSEVSISYTFEGQKLNKTAYIAYNVEHTLTVEVSKLKVEENATGINGLTIISNNNNVQFKYVDLVVDGSFTYATYTFKITDTKIKSFDVYVTVEKVVNSQLTIFKSNTITFNLKEFVVKSIDIVTDDNNSDVLSLATNTSKELKVVLDAQYNTADSSILSNIKSLQDKIAKNLTSWQVKPSAMSQFETLSYKQYPNYTTSRNNSGYIQIQPTKSSSGEEIYLAIKLNYEKDFNKSYAYQFITSAQVTDKIGFVENQQTLISKITTNFFQDVSATSSIPVGNLINEEDYTYSQQLTQTGEVDFVKLANGTADGKLYYRLKEDLTLSNYTPLDLNYVEFDGNGYTITITSFSETALASGNFGLFASISNTAFVKNLNIQYNLPSGDLNQFDFTKNQTDLNTIKFGGLTSTNSGIVYNVKVSGGVIFKTPASTTDGIQVYVGGLIAQNSGTVSFSQSSLYIHVNRGYVGGFIAENMGKISNNKVLFAGYGINNTATTEVSTLIGGFVARNSGEIYGCYISGSRYIYNDGRYIEDRIISYTSVGAFANKNTGKIYNSYANILVDCQTRSSGFVYDNMGSITSCYTASKMTLNNTAHNPFIGVGESGVNNTGTVTDCYYLADDFGSTAQEPATKLTSLKEVENFAGFVFADNNSINGTWQMGQYGPTLVDADLIIESIQYYDGVQFDNNNKQYYSWIHMGVPEGEGGFGIYNFRTISTFEQLNDYIYYQDINNNTTSDYFVLLCDINCDNYVTPQSAELSFKGTFIGNNMSINNLYLKASNTNTNAYFGLFGELKFAIVKDLTIKAKQAIANNTAYVGILAGRILNSDVTNIIIDGSNVNVQGKYFVGGVTGYASRSTLVKINVSATVNASYRGTENYADVFNGIKTDNNYNFTYSGVAVGVLTGVSTLKDVTVTGNSMAIGYYASACVGLVDTGSTLSLASVQIDANQYVRAYYVAGGLVAENRGVIDRCSIAHEDKIQSNIDKNNSTANRNLSFFAGSPQIIGGLVGFNNGGLIIYSYSKLDVRAETMATKVAGGLVGTIISGTIDNCYATGSVIGRRVIGGLVGSVTEKEKLCYVQNEEVLNSSAVFKETDIDDGNVLIKNSFASNRWLTGSNYNDLDIISAAFQKGLLIGCFNKENDSYYEYTIQNCFVNTQVTQNTTKVDIDTFVQLTQNPILVAFNSGNAIESDSNSNLNGNLTDIIINKLSCGEYTINFDGTSSGGNRIEIDNGIQCKNEGTYITFYFLNNYDANMNILDADGIFNAPSNNTSIYATIVKNLNK